MKHLTQSQIIYNLLHDEPMRWFKSYELIKVSTKYGWLGSGTDRRARELVESGQIETRKQGIYAEFRAKEVILPKSEPQRPPMVLPQFARERVGTLQMSF